MRTVNVFFAVVCLLVANIACSKDWATLFKDAIANEGRLEFYGKVVDQDGNPVEGLAVLYSTTSAGFPKPIYRKGCAKTDKNGLFTIKGGRVCSLYIKDIEMPGYEFIYDSWCTSFDYRRDYSYRHKPDKSRPVLLHVRRKDHKGSFLLEDGIGIELSMEQENGRDGRECGRDFAQKKTYGLSGYSRDTAYSYFRGLFWDIEATGEADREKGVWNVILRANGAKAGIQRVDTLLYAAPEDGYFRELKLTIPFGTQKRTPMSGDSPLSILHFYARLRDPGMYARLDVERIVADESRFDMDCSVLINPYGDRSFEKLTFLLLKLSDTERNRANAKLRNKIDRSLRLYHDSCETPAMQAMREQRLATRPPFEEWIREGLAFW